MKLPARILPARTLVEVIYGTERTKDYNLQSRGQNPRLVEPIGVMVGEILKVSPSTVDGWLRRDIKFELYQADRMALKAGYLPHHVWGPLWQEACDLEDEYLNAAPQKELTLYRESQKLKVAAAGFSTEQY